MKYIWISRKEDLIKILGYENEEEKFQITFGKGKIYIRSSRLLSTKVRMKEIWSTLTFYRNKISIKYMKNENMFNRYLCVSKVEKKEILMVIEIYRNKRFDSQNGKESYSNCNWKQEKYYTWLHVDN